MKAMGFRTTGAKVHGMGDGKARSGDNGKLVAKSQRRKCFRDQVMIFGPVLKEDIKVQKVEPLTIYDEGGNPTGQKLIGLVNGRRVEAVRRAGWQVNGRSPYIWEYA